MSTAISTRSANTRRLSTASRTNGSLLLIGNSSCCRQYDGSTKKLLTDRKANVGEGRARFMPARHGARQRKFAEKSAERGDGRRAKRQSRRRYGAPRGEITAR